MRLSAKWVIGAALLALVLVLALGSALLRPPQPLILDASISPGTITPNADGSDDITVIAYRLSRTARVTLMFDGAAGARFDFRRDELRTSGDYSVFFSGVVDGFVNEGEQVQGEVLRRLMPDGEYTWRLQAVGEDGAVEERSGTLVLRDGEAQLPDIVEFTIYPTVFTPNQDGLRDRAGINVGLLKAADLQVMLQREGEQPIYVPERVTATQPDQPALRRYYDYDGGVDLGADPPADGDYIVVALAQDAVGQRVQRTGSLTIENGGKPLAQIVPQPSGATVIFEDQPYSDSMLTTADQRGTPVALPEGPQVLSSNAITMPVGDLLVFALTVENYGSVPIRTAGSAPGTVYQWDQTAASFREYDESGAWRVGIDCDTAGGVYPWRWRVGSDADLRTETDPESGDVYYYLPAGARAVVWGAVRLTQIEVRNPQNCWAGLIHEDVAISQLNDYVGPRRIFLTDPDAGQSANAGG
jgi:hypothetical protein